MNVATLGFHVYLCAEKFHAGPVARLWSRFTCIAGLEIVVIHTVRWEAPTFTLFFLCVVHPRTARHFVGKSDRVSRQLLENLKGSGRPAFKGEKCADCLNVDINFGC